MKKYNLEKEKNIFRFFKTVKIIPILIFLVVIIVSIISPLFLKHDPYFTYSGKELLSPNSEFLLGTDDFGRDLLSRIFSGVKSSLYYTIIGVLINAFIGIYLGAIAGYYDNKISEIIMRLTDVMLGFPGIILSMTVVGVLGPSITNTIIALSISGWAEFCRFTRALILKEKTNEYVTTAILNNNSNFRIIRRYLLPNILPQ